MSSQLLTHLSAIDAELADRLENDERFRRRYIRFFAQTEVAAEIRTLRKKRRLRQAEVAKLAKTGQSAISRIEKAGYDGWTFKTLIAIAEELKARLRITFEPIEDVARGYRGLTTQPDDVIAIVAEEGTARSAIPSSMTWMSDALDVFETEHTALTHALYD